MALTLRALRTSLVDLNEESTAPVHSDWMIPVSILGARSTAGTLIILVRGGGGPLWRIITVLIMSDFGCDPNEISYKLNRLVSLIAV